MARPLVIPVFIPHRGCPHQCVFCNQTSITGQASRVPDQRQITRTIREYLAYQGNRTRVELAFFGGNFLGLSKPLIRRLLDDVHPFLETGDIHAIRFSTRPDTVLPDRLDLLRDCRISLVELGVQSMNDPVLERVNRGHTAADSVQAISLLRSRGMGVGVQVMVGLPGEDEAGLLRGAGELARMKPDAARIYPVVVLKDTRLADWYGAGDYTPLDLDEAVRLTGRMVRIFTDQGVPVIRMGLAATDGVETDILAGPYHPAFGHLVLSDLMFERVIEQIRQRRSQGPWTLRVHPRAESRLRGNRNRNLHRLAEAYPGQIFRIETDSAIPLDRVILGR